MKFCDLVSIQKAGVLEVDKDNSTKERVIIAKTPMNPVEVENFLTNLGWTNRRSLEPVQLVEKTGSYIRNLARYIDSDFFYENAEFSFENIGIRDSLKTFDRVIINLPDQSYTIIHGMPGLGGSYAIFDPKVSRSQPVLACRSFKGVGEYLNEYAG